MGDQIISPKTGFVSYGYSQPATNTTHEEPIDLTKEDQQEQYKEEVEDDDSVKAYIGGGYL